MTWRRDADSQQHVSFSVLCSSVQLSPRLPSCHLCRWLFGTQGGFQPNAEVTLSCFNTHRVAAPGGQQLWLHFQGAPFMLLLLLLLFFTLVTDGLGGFRSIISNAAFPSTDGVTSKTGSGVSGGCVCRKNSLCHACPWIWSRTPLYAHEFSPHAHLHSNLPAFTLLDPPVVHTFLVLFLVHLHFLFTSTAESAFKSPPLTASRVYQFHTRRFPAVPWIKPQIYQARTCLQKNRDI